MWRVGVCLPFHTTSGKPAGWEYSVFVFICLNLVSFIVIFLGYMAIFITVKAAAKKMGDTSTSTMDEYSLAKKLVAIVAADFICWVRLCNHFIVDSPRVLLIITVQFLITVRCAVYSCRSSVLDLLLWETLQ